MGSGGDDAVGEEYLRACYEAFAQRRLRRGARSIRTRQGYERLREKYQPRLRFLQEAATNVELLREGGATAVVEETKEKGKPPEAAEEKFAYGAMYSDEEGDTKDVESLPTRLEQESMERVATVVDLDVDGPRPASSESEPDSEVNALWQLVGVFFDKRIKQLVFETVWPLVHQGGGDDQSNRPVKPPPIPEWQELEQHKYYAFMFKTLLWLFPGLPAFEAQEQAEEDWTKDCEFDAFGTYGLSFEGFIVSLLDLALACTDGSIDKCVEFLSHLTRRLEASLPVFRVPTITMLPSRSNEDNDDLPINPYEQIVWRTVPLEKFCPCPVRVRPLFLEFKAKLSAAPIVLMVLAGNERRVELQLSTSAKLLVRERDHRSSVRRNTMQTDELSHFIEIEKQFLWTFRSFPGHPTLLIVPSALLSKRTLSLYACCRLLESHEHSLGHSAEATDSVDTILTFFSAVHEPFPLLYGPDNSLCGKVDRQSSRLLIINHHGRVSSKFKLVFRTSLIHNTASAGSVGAAAIVAAVPSIDSMGTAECKSELVGGSTQLPSYTSAHSFIFVVKMTSDILANGPQRRRASTVGAGAGTSKASDASVPAQWFTTLCGANENKTIFMDADTAAKPGDDSDDSSANVYYVYIFTLHGFYYEAVYEDCDDTSNAANPLDNSAISVLTNSRATSSHDAGGNPLGSVIYAAEGEEAALLAQFGAHDSSLNSSKASIKNVTTSASLLRQLLLLRKQRQNQVRAESPPDFLGGSKITSMKALSAAAGLRAKFLKARAVDRRARYIQHEEVLQAKVLAKLKKTEVKKRTMRGYVADVDGDEEAGTISLTESATFDSNLEAKVTLLSSFFKEMAIYQPSQHEIEQGGNEYHEHAEKEDELLQNFADLFDDDHALHNLLHAEKWLSMEEKTTRRKSILAERMEHRRQSLLSLNQRQVHGLHNSQDDGQIAEEDAAKLRKKSTPPRASEDYYSTAMLISQLMREVAEEEQAQGFSTRRSDCHKRELAESNRVAQLSASWHHASVTDGEPISPESRIESGTQSNCVNQDTPVEVVQQFSTMRRDDWLTSHYVHDLGVNERLKQRHANSRPTLVPNNQSLTAQEYPLPWIPVWEVRAPVKSQDGGDDGIQCQSPQQRPKTANPFVLTPRPPTATARTARPSTEATCSATLSRLHTRRIRSARSEGTARRLHYPTHAENASGGNQNQGVQPSSGDKIGFGGTSFDCQNLPRAFFHDLELTAGPLESDQPHACNDSDLQRSRVPRSQNEGSLVELQAIQSRVVGDQTSSGPIDGKSSRKLKRKITPRLTREQKRFAERVQELLAMSAIAKSSLQPQSAMD